MSVKLNAWTQVKVSNKELERDGQAGRVVIDEADPAKDGEADVQFDLDGQVETHKVADLTVLG